MSYGTPNPLESEAVAHGSVGQADVTLWRPRRLGLEDCAFSQ